MKKSIRALIVTSIVGIVGVYLGAFLMVETLGVALTIATMGYFVISTIEDVCKK